jgi:hypothetical protein
LTEIFCSHEQFILNLFGPGRLKSEKLTDDGRQVMTKAHMAFWPGELKRKDKYWI